jgi:hypothetical protein
MCCFKDAMFKSVSDQLACCAAAAPTPPLQVSLSRVFATMAGSKAAGLAVLDWGVANATLEEVFIRFARQIGAKAGD